MNIENIMDKHAPKQTKILVTMLLLRCHAPCSKAKQHECNSNKNLLGFDDWDNGETILPLHSSLDEYSQRCNILSKRKYMIR